MEEDCIREREPERNFDAVSPEWTEKPEGGTSFLSKAREPGLFLRSESAAYPDLRITKDSFLIGKKKDAVDGWLKARGISRIHGRISREEDCYDLTDLNATNGTYLNGGRLEDVYKRQIFVSGGTGSGKTTFLNALSEFIPETARVITIEDNAEPVSYTHLDVYKRQEAFSGSHEYVWAVSVRHKGNR